ncbi:MULTISPECIES: c-type cytochrome [Flavobacterium]|uniref:C-type cytochrome n=1 Tax=Flavobacterium jumunjinense TaxID=998845 RepID=A0ABV5GP23_9FLAO|nr:MULTISPECIES: cytochrome c [Flavobacterium]
MKQLKNIIFISSSLLLLSIFVIYYLLTNYNIDSKKVEAQKLEEIISKKESKLFEKGKTIFIGDCKVCHVMKYHGHNFLNGIFKRVDSSYFKFYITKQDSLLKSNDKYALETKKNFGNNGMIHSFKYNNEEIKALLDYLK